MFWGIAECYIEGLCYIEIYLLLNYQRAGCVGSGTYVTACYIAFRSVVVVHAEASFYLEYP